METLSELIAKYRNGDTNAAERLLVKLHPLENKYLRVIKTGYGSYSEGVDFFLSRLNHPGGTGSCLAWLVDRSKRYKEDEIRQEIRISILECAYLKPYFYGHFTNILAKNIKELFGAFDNELPLDDESYEEPEEDLANIEVLDAEEYVILRVYEEEEFSVRRTAERLKIHSRTVYRRLETIKEKLLNESNKDREDWPNL